MTTPPPAGGPAPRAERPTEASWRADALAGSRHSRLADELRPPLEDRDPERAAALCAEIGRDLLRDLAPALLLLSAADRRRAQTLLAYGRTLFDFATQRGVEGERLAQLNRWEFELERALDGDPPGQPVFVALAREQAQRPWPRAALAALGRAARRRVAQEKPAPLAQAPELARDLAAAAIEALLGAPPAAETAALAAAVLRARGLQDLPAAFPERRRTAVEIEAALAAAAPAPAALPRPYRPAAAYLRLAARRLARAEPAPGHEAQAQIGAWSRIALLVRARLLGR
jgi:hypothetical protein